MAEQVALLEDISKTSHGVYQGAGFEVVTYPKSINADDLAALAAESVVLGVRSGPQVSAEVLSDKLQAVGVYGAGVNHIARHGEEGSDAKGIDERGIPLFNASHENTHSVAELVIGAAFSLLRNIHWHNMQMHAGIWTKSNGEEMRGKSITTLGYGSVGSQVSVMAEALGMNVYYYDKISRLALGRAVSLPTEDEALAAGDVVTLHVPGAKENYHLIDAGKLAEMKPGSYLINAARGDLVDYDAMIEALDGGHLAGAAVDVYTDAGTGYTEPSKRGDPFDHLLREHPKVLLLPHIGGSTTEAQDQIGESVSRNIVAYLTRGSTMGSVNFPNKAPNDLPEGISRLLYIHDDQPGALAVAVDALAEHGLNAVDSVLGTKDGLGYYASDIQGKIPSAVIDTIREQAVTRRVGVIEDQNFAKPADGSGP